MEEKPEKPIKFSPEVELAIIKAVQDGFKNLPGETLERVQDIADRRVEKTEKYFKILAGFVVAAVILGGVLFWNVTSENVRERVEAQLTQTTNRLVAIEELYQRAVAYDGMLGLRITNFITTTDAIDRRLADFKLQGKPVFYDALGNLILRPKGGVIRIENDENPRVERWLGIDTNAQGIDQLWRPKEWEDKER